METTVKQLTPAQIEAEIKERNKVFKKANKLQKRILICQDVINNIRIGRLIPDSGRFIRTFDSSFIDDFGGKNLQPLLFNQSCECCALGATFLSTTLFTNNLKVEDTGWAGDSILDAVKDGINPKNDFLKIFGRKMLASVEVAFERGIGAFQDDEYNNTDGLDILGEELFNRCKKFARSENPKKRMIKIMNNIIKNGGEFKP